MFENIAKNMADFVSDHKDEIAGVVIAVGVVGSALLFYNSSFNYGYECRKNLEKAAGNGLFDAIEKFGNEYM